MTGIPISRTAAEQRRRFLTVAEAADLLGISTATVHRAIRSGDFPAIKIRGRYVVPAKALDDMEAAALRDGLVDIADHTAHHQPPSESPTKARHASDLHR